MEWLYQDQSHQSLSRYLIVICPYFTYSWLISINGQLMKEPEYLQWRAWTEETTE